MQTNDAVSLPGQKEFHIPTLRALKNLGGSGKIREITDEVAKLMNLDSKQLVVPHKQDHFQYVNRTKWSIHRLFKIGMLDKPRRGFYTLTEKGKASINVSPEYIEQEFSKHKRQPAKESMVSDTEKSSLFDLSGQQHTSFPYNLELRGQSPATNSMQTDGEDTSIKNSGSESSPILLLDDLVDSHVNWREQLLDSLRQLPPVRFESFVGNVLQKSGLSHVEFFRSDAVVCEGIAIMGGGLLSQKRVRFRCWRDRSQRVVDDVTDFRREVSTSRAAHGMLIALGGFTNVAVSEANRQSTPFLDLIDGESFASTLKDLGLGAKSEVLQVERTIVDFDFFANI